MFGMAISFYICQFIHHEESSAPTIISQFLRSSNSSVHNSVNQTPSPTPQVKWTTLESLLDVNFTERNFATGCPPLPTLCRLDHVFDEIMIISLPRFHVRYMRVISQLDEMNVPYTLVHARDARSPGSAEIVQTFFHDWRDHTGAIFSLFLTQLAILDYTAKSPMRAVLMLEDDVIFRADFPARFDKLARNLPDDWRVLWFGLNMESGYTLSTDFQPIDWPGGEKTGYTTLPQPPYEEKGHAGFFGAFSVGFQREAAKLTAETMLRNRTVIDVYPYVTLLQTWPTRTFVASPPLAIMNISAESTLRGNVVSNTKFWNTVNNIDNQYFDVNRGYYIGGENGLEYQCNIQIGYDRAGYDLATVHANSQGECCNACIENWPLCRSWTWNPQSSGCWLKYRVSELVSSESYFITGIVES
jgi:GR25 family glycosyltransferase involved in LPS biosynthesis